MQREDTRRALKYEVLKEVSELKFNDELTQENIEKIPYNIIPGSQPRFRCCVYKEREIIRQRVQLAMGKPPIPPHNAENYKVTDNVIQVIPAACEGCPINRFQVTENCQKCMAKACQRACAFGAITITGRGAYIDQDKCRECGRCAEACPYHAIADLMRPCKRSCDVGAISIGEDKLAVINEEKCISCGHCAQACPFGAISDTSVITEVIDALNSEKRTVAIPAPAVEGQFGPNATVGRVITALKKLGFDDVYEVALGGDAVSYFEAKELMENKDAGKKMTTSCCPAFANLIRKHYPTLLENMSTTVSPMQAVYRWIKKNDSDAYVVFIGPCMAKKDEVKYYNEDIAVITFEELNAIFDAKGIDPNECEEEESLATSYGRRFSGSGGVAASVAKAVNEMNYDKDIKLKPCSGVKECKVGLAMLKAGKLPEDIIEGMACEGGCIAGPGAIELLNKLKAARMKKIKGRDEDNITDMLTSVDFMDVPMHRDKQ